MDDLSPPSERFQHRSYSSGRPNVQDVAPDTGRAAPWTDASSPHLPRRALMAPTNAPSRCRRGALHLESLSWACELLDLLESLTGNPMVRLIRASHSPWWRDRPRSGLAPLEWLELCDSHRAHAVCAHLREDAGDVDAAARYYATAAVRTANAREHDHPSSRRRISAR
jgi:hypothetical protein